MKNSLIIIVITYLMAALGLASANLTAEIGTAFLLTSLIIVLISLPANLMASLKPTEIRRRLWNITAIALFIYFSIDYLLIKQDLLGSAARFLTILAAIKLFDLYSPRDYLIFYSLVFFQILTAAASTISPLFFLIMSIFIICAIWAMIVFNILGDYVRHYPGEKRLPPNLFPFSFFLTTVALTFCSIFITLLLFFLIPRVGIGFFDTRTLAGLKVSGFSEKITFGDFGEVKKDTTIVMRVELPAGALPKKRRLYFRGQSLDSYVPSGWEASVRKDTRIWKKEDNRYVLDQSIKIGPDMIEQRIMLEPLETDVIFAASRPVIIDGRFPTLWTNNSGSLYLPDIPYSRIEYTVFSILSSRVKEDRETKAIYLDITHVSPEVVELATEITIGEQKDIDKAHRIERYLKENYKYTLNPVKGGGRTPLDDFLISTKEGYCEHFATAMAILLRSVNIPARIATGFLNGEWNEYGNYYLVRQQDAHSWVEAEIDGFWTRFDPTPSVGLVGSIRTSSFNMYIDSLRFKWRRYIIRYSLTDQFKIGRTIETKASWIIDGIRDFSVGLKNILNGTRSLSLRELKNSPLYIAAMLVLIIAALLILMRLRGRPGPWGRPANRVNKTPGFYIIMVDSLMRKGIERRRGETPGEFALRSGNQDVKNITATFEEIRYGHKELSQEKRKFIEERLKRLKAS